LAALSIRPFRWWFVGQVTSASGLMTQIVAVAWLVLQWHGSGVQLALVSAASLSPTLVFGLWAGAVIDHHDRRHLLIATQSLLALQSLVLYALIVTGAASYWPIVGLSALAGLVNAFDAPARQVYVLELVGKQQLAAAVGLYEVVLNLSRVLGPALGGVLLATSGPAACVLVNALSFTMPLAVLLIYKPHRDLAATPDHQSARPKVRDGVRYAWSDPVIRSCLLLAAASGILFNATVLLPLLADRVFHLGGGGYGLLLALFGLGALPGALLAGSGGRQPTGRQVSWLATLTGACVVVTALAPVEAVLFAGMAATGASSIWMIASANTLVQLRAAPEMRGRVMGAWSVALPGTVPITAVVAGVLADALGARVAYATAGVVIAGIAVACWRNFAR
jgi:MFS family permease